MRKDKITVFKRLLQPLARHSKALFSHENIFKDQRSFLTKKKLWNSSQKLVSLQAHSASISNHPPHFMLKISAPLSKIKVIPKEKHWLNYDVNDESRFPYILCLHSIFSSLGLLLVKNIQVADGRFSQIELSLVNINRNGMRNKVKKFKKF